MSRPHENWIVATGQAWKLYVALIGFAGALICFTVAIFSLGWEGGRLLGMAGVGVLLGLATFIWFSVTIRCPHCAAKLVWTMVTNRPHSSWMIDLAGLDSCPRCRHPLVASEGRRYGKA